MYLSTSYPIPEYLSHRNESTDLYEYVSRVFSMVLVKVAGRKGDGSINNDISTPQNCRQSFKK